MTRHFDRTALRHARTPAATPSATPTFSGYSCEVTVGTGRHGNKAHNYTTMDSSEFYFNWTAADSTTYAAVTSNCIGVLPTGVQAPKNPVSHNLACDQFNPNDSNAIANKDVIQGYGIETTYPDRMYSESCTTPNALPVL